MVRGAWPCTVPSPAAGRELGSPGQTELGPPSEVPAPGTNPVAHNSQLRGVPRSLPACTRATRTIPHRGGSSGSHPNSDPRERRLQTLPRQPSGLSDPGNVPKGVHVKGATSWLLTTTHTYRGRRCRASAAEGPTPTLMVPLPPLRQISRCPPVLSWAELRGRLSAICTWTQLPRGGPRGGGSGSWGPGCFSSSVSVLWGQSGEGSPLQLSVDLWKAPG